MTKAKTVKKAAPVDGKADKAPAKAKTDKAPAKAKKETAAIAAKGKAAAAPARKEPKTAGKTAKTTAAAAKGKTPAKGTAKVKTPVEKKPAKVAGKAVKPVKAKADETRARVAEAPSSPPATAEPVSEPTPVSGFQNFGLGVKVASRKPGLSVAPGVMILGRSVSAKPDAVAKPSERKLSKKELTDIKTFLIEKRERLLAGMRRELAMQRERAESKAADEVDKATDAYDEDLSFEIATANDQELEEIQVALEKIERGTYGECEICGTNISPSRLKILPSATTCVACRGQEEMARRRDDSPNFAMMTGEDGETETGEG